MGKKCPSGLPATNIVRLKEGWMKDYEVWQKRDYTGTRYVYFWADGIYFNVRLDKERPCILVIMGALEDGTILLLFELRSFLTASSMLSKNDRTSRKRKSHSDDLYRATTVQSKGSFRGIWRRCQRGAK